MNPFTLKLRIDFHYIAKASQEFKVDKVKIFNRLNDNGQTEICYLITGKK